MHSIKVKSKSLAAEVMMQTKQNEIWKNECVLIEILETYKEHF